METPHFSVFRLRDGEEVNELSYNLAKIHCAQDENTEESLLSRNVETTAVIEQPAVESAVVALSISEAAPTPVERKSNEPSLLAKIIAKIKGLFATKSEENKPKITALRAILIVINAVHRIVVLLVVHVLKITKQKEPKNRFVMSVSVINAVRAVT